MTHVDENEKDITSQDPALQNAGNALPDDVSEDFEAMLGSYLGNIVQHQVDTLIMVPVVEVAKDHVLVELGDKAEGVIDINEFTDAQGNVAVKPGETIAVQVLGRDEETGLITVSYKQARSQAAWLKLEQAFEKKVTVSGKISRAVKGGVLVDTGIECFMPASQISDRKVANLEEWVGKDVEAYIVDFDRRKNKVVLSRRAVIEETRKKLLEETLTKYNEGDEVEATVKSVMGFGAFLEIGGLEATIQREELSWEKAANPASVLKPGAVIKVKILQIDRETGRMKVSRKALVSDPWAGISVKYPTGTVITGEVVSITNFGAFVRLEEGITGLIHVNDLSWSKGSQRVTDFVKEGDTVSAAILSVDSDKKRISLGLKQTLQDPWVEAEKKFPRGSRVSGVITGLTTFGAFVKLTDEIEGLIHISDIDWEGNVKHPGDVLKAGDTVEAMVLKTDANTRRISLGLKQLKESPQSAFFREHPEGSSIEGEVLRFAPTGAYLSIGPKIEGFLHVSQMAIERVDKPEQVLKVGDKVTCKITKIEKGSKVSLSRKQLLLAEESSLVKQYAASPKDKGGLNLGDLLSNLKIQEK